MRTTRCFAIVLAATFVPWSHAASREAPKPEDFLNRLVGSWDLTGTMGSTALRQRVDAQWVIQGRFLQMHFVEEMPAQGRPPYEATYMLGYDGEAGKYILQLFDTFGATYSRTVGIGTRRGDSVDFLFEYPSGRFSNTFQWDQATGRWTMLLRQKERSGTWKLFATKTLSRTTASSEPSGSRTSAEVGQTAEVRRAIEAGNATREKAFRTLDAAAIASTFDVEGVNVGADGACTKGREAIEASMRTYLERSGPATSTSIVIGNVALDGDLAYEWGHSEFHFAGKPSGPKARVGRYLAVWKRQPDGGWKLLRNLGLPERPSAQ